MANARLRELITVAGVEVQVRDRRGLEAKFKALGGRVVDFGDKSAILEFPTAQAARDYEREAKARGGMFGKMEPGDWD